MKIGYPCINQTLHLSSSRTFRLASYSESKFKEIVDNNLNALTQILEYNVSSGLLAFRITSDLIPFASHPVCQLNWQDFYQGEFLALGKIIKKNNLRISLHPDQFVLINSLREDVLEASLRELHYQCEVLDLMGLNTTHKVQIHVGGVYDDKQASLKRFITRYKELPVKIKKRLVIENDDRLYNFADCLFISKKTGVPIVLDVFHHKCNNQKESLDAVLKKVVSTWKKNDGVPMLDYSSQDSHKKPGSHAPSIDVRDFADFASRLGRRDYDIILEIKDKEKSALKALAILKKLKKIK
ncbi:MAG: UV DNA damage repair endonuclease UvsE [Patescibacteria group bacterium]|jgi:UV DNA damage endonuclease